MTNLISKQKPIKKVHVNKGVSKNGLGIEILDAYD